MICLAAPWPHVHEFGSFEGAEHSAVSGYFEVQGSCLGA